MKKHKPEIIKFKSFKEKSGTLIPFYMGKHLPKNFILKRFFFLYGKKKFLRADHAHKKCTQILIPIIGKIKITTYFNKKKKIFKLDNKITFLKYDRPDVLPTPSTRFQEKKSVVIN